ncbi:thermonuclease family protein [Micropruina glycogenica]|uniref:thermonuclease family protein n=1 Tax=Micropruina glycogenica TaxID=75385 RepID=UPI001319D2DF|nr:thermonuclease family protein [Micropruina glycogenica]
MTGCQLTSGHPTTTAAAAVELRRPRVVDGDTFDATDADGRRVRVRLIGVDAPEIRHGATPAQCGAVQAQQELRRLLATVASLQMVPDPNSVAVDRYGRRLGYVQIEAGDVALLLLRAGVVEAWGPRGAAAPTRLSDYRAAQQVAQDAGAGSWRTCGTLGR